MVNFEQVIAGWDVANRLRGIKKLQIMKILKRLVIKKYNYLKNREECHWLLLQ